MNEKGLFYLEKKYAEALNALVGSKTKKSKSGDKKKTA